MKLVSIIIPTYNRMEMLEKCMQSVLASEYSQLELIVIDNASTDGTVDTVNRMIKQNARIRIVELKENLMASGGRNEGIKEAQGDYLLFLDNDNIIDNQMIGKLVEHMEKDDTIGLLGPVSLNKYVGDLIWALSGKYNFWTSRPVVLGGGKKLIEKYKHKMYATYYSPNAFMVKKEVVKKVGGLDTSYFAMYEEADYGYRIHNVGYKEFIITDAVTYHYGYVESDEVEVLRHLGINNPERAYHFAKNRTIFMKKYAPRYCLPFYLLCTVHAFNIYYCLIALRYKRTDIAKAFFRGTIRGLFTKVTKEVYIEP